MVLPIGFAVTRIPSSGGGDHWVAYTTTSAFTGVGVRGMANLDAILLNIEGDDENQIYSLDATSPLTENWKVRCTAASGPGGTRYMAGSDGVNGSDSGDSNSAQMDISYNSTTSRVLVSGTYMVDQYGNMQPCYMFFNATNGSLLNEQVSFHSGANSYSQAYLPLTYAENGKLYGTGYYSDSNESPTNGTIEVRGINVYAVDTKKNTSTYGSYRKAPMYTRLSPNGNYGFQGALISDSSIGGNSFLVSYWWINNGSAATSNTYTNTYNERLSSDNFASCSTNTGITYTGLTALPSSSTSRYATMIQKFASGMGYTSSNDFGTPALRVIQGNFTDQQSLIDICVDSTNTYVYALIADKSQNAITVVKINASDMTINSKLQITNTNITDTFDSGSYTRKKYANFDLYDDDNLIITHFTSGKIALMRIPTDLSTSGTYGSFTFGASALSTSTRPSFSTSYDPYIQLIPSAGGRRSLLNTTTHGSSSTAYNGNLSQVTTASHALSFTEDSL